MPADLVQTRIALYLLEPVEEGRGQAEYSCDRYIPLKGVDDNRILQADIAQGSVSLVEFVDGGLELLDRLIVELPVTGFRSHFFGG